MRTPAQSIPSEAVAHFCIRAALPRARAPKGARGLGAGGGRKGSVRPCDPLRDGPPGAACSDRRDPRPPPARSLAYAQPLNARTKSCSTRNFSYRITPFRFCPNSANRSLSRPLLVT